MKLRHARTAVIAVGLVVALTGARGSHGGGCSSNHSSSTSGGSNHDDYDGDDYDIDVPDVDAGTSGSTGTGSSSPAASDLDIDGCAYEEYRGLVGKVTASNSDATTTYTYDFTVVFKDAAGATLTTTTGTISYVPALQDRTQDVAAAYVPSGPDATNGGTCEITNATKTAV
ncbi:MAG TPA: hypothetical protein VFP69_06565 [Streptomyces sp.]|nr:hypothetical protein [Streptomyces sp.]